MNKCNSEFLFYVFLNKFVIPNKNIANHGQNVIINGEGLQILRVLQRATPTVSTWSLENPTMTRGIRL